MAVTLAQLSAAYPGWHIQDVAGPGDGWCAIRIILVPTNTGLSNVRCGADLDELRRHLEAETRGQSRGRSPGSRGRD